MKTPVTEKANKHLTKKEFYTLSWTWGLLMTLIGAIVCSVILIYGKVKGKNYKLKRHGWCYYISVGKNWGGLELGMFFLCDSRESLATMWHEHGHGIQNCYWGLLTPFVISIPSAIRYWIRRDMQKKGITPKTGYYDIWFEKEANDLGKKYRKYIEEGN